MRIRNRKVSVGLGVFLVAVAMRLGVLPVASRAPLGEGHAFLDAAANIAQGNGLCLSESLLVPPLGDAPPILARTLKVWRESGGIWGVVPPGKPTAFLPPAYPLLLSALMRTPLPTVPASRVLGALLGALIAYLIYQLGKRFGGSLHGVVAGLLVAVDPLATFQSVEISTHTFAAFTLVLPFYFVSRQRFTVPMGFVTGLMLGVAFLVRPTSWFMIPLLMIAVKDHRRALWCISMLVLGASIIIGTWTVRNALSVGKPLVFTTNGGRNLWEFNNQKLGPEYLWSEPAESRRLYDPIRAAYLPGIRRPELLPFPTFRAEPEWERDRRLTERVTAFIRANPRVYARLVGVRVCQILSLSPLHCQGKIATMFVAFNRPLLILAFIGLWWAVKTGGIPRLMALYVLAFFGMHALTAAGFVYRGMISPLLAFFAAAVIARHSVRIPCPVPDESARPEYRRPPELRSRAP